MLLVVALAAVVSACEQAAPSVSPVALPVANFPNACRGIGVDAILHGDPGDARSAWLSVGGVRNELVWPPGYKAVFTPSLVVFDESGAAVFREGDHINGACLSGAIDGTRVLRISQQDRAP